MAHPWSIKNSLPSRSRFLRHPDELLRDAYEIVIKRNRDPHSLITGSNDVMCRASRYRSAPDTDARIYQRGGPHLAVSRCPRIPAGLVLPLTALVVDRRLVGVCVQRNASGSQFFLKRRPDAGGGERPQRAAFGRNSLLLEQEHILHADDVDFHSGDLGDN